MTSWKRSGDDLDTVITNSTMMEVDVLPEHLAIVGGSYVGLEFTQMYRRFGSQVTVVEMGERLIRHEDADVSKTVREILEAEGVTVRLNAECIGVSGNGDGIAVGVECGQGPPEVVGSHLLLAVGRRPNTADLGADGAGLKLDQKASTAITRTSTMRVVRPVHKVKCSAGTATRSHDSTGATSRPRAGLTTP